MIKIFKTEENKILSRLSISEAVSGSWFSLIDPTEEEIKQVSLVLGLDEDFLRNSLDLDERSRIEFEDGNTLIITNLPIMTEDGCFDTLPLGIIYTPTSIITVCSKDNTLSVRSCRHRRSSILFGTGFQKRKYSAHQPCVCSSPAGKPEDPAWFYDPVLVPVQARVSSKCSSKFHIAPWHKHRDRHGCWSPSEQH